MCLCVSFQKKTAEILGLKRLGELCLLRIYYVDSRLLEDMVISVWRNFRSERDCLREYDCFLRADICD